MEITRSGSEPSGKGSAEYFTGTVRDSSVATVEEDELISKVVSLLSGLVGFRRTGGLAYECLVLCKSYFISGSSRWSH